MNKRTKIQLIEYLLLLALIFIGFYSILLLKDQKYLQIFSVILMACAYTVWGVAHHLVEKTFHLKIVVEYTLLSIVVATLLIILLSLV